MRILLIAEKTAEGEANVIACRKNPARICFELGDYLPNKDLGNIFEKFENSEELEEYLENEDYDFAAVKRRGKAIRQLKLLLDMAKDPCNHLLVAKECESGKKGKGERRCILRIYQPTPYYEYDVEADTPEERSKLREKGVAAEVFRVGLNFMGIAEIDPELAKKIPIPRQPLQEIRDPKVRGYIIDKYAEILKAKS